MARGTKRSWDTAFYGIGNLGKMTLEEVKSYVEEFGRECVFTLICYNYSREIAEYYIKKGYAKILLRRVEDFDPEIFEIVMGHFSSADEILRSYPQFFVDVWATPMADAFFWKNQRLFPYAVSDEAFIKAAEKCPANIPTLYWKYPRPITTAMMVAGEKDAMECLLGYLPRNLDVYQRDPTDINEIVPETVIAKSLMRFLDYERYDLALILLDSRIDIDWLSDHGKALTKTMREASERLKEASNHFKVPKRDICTVNTSGSTVVDPISEESDESGDASSVFSSCSSYSDESDGYSTEY